jgi:pimeloyl-ACP methyl ester carboxylesterase
MTQPSGTEARDASIQPGFLTVDGLRIRYARGPEADPGGAGTAGAETVLLLSPWPESLFAFWPMWPRLAQQFSLIAVDLPGFGQSQGRPDLMSPRAMGEFVTRLVAELAPGPVHAVGPDVGTGALLSAAAAHPETFKSLVVGAGAATYPLRVGGVLKDIIDAPSLDPFRQLDPADVVHQVAGAIRNYAMPDFVLNDYLASYAGARYIESVPYVRSYPADLAALAPLLPDLRTPVQIIVGRDDPYGLADDAEVLNRELPDGRLDVLNTGHCAWEEDPGRYASITADWITRAAKP